MKHLLKLLIFSLLLIIAVTACNSNQKEDDIPIENLTKSVDSDLYKLISGKWQLMEVRASFVSNPPFVYDCSEYNIVYEFKTNGVLIVSGETDESIGYTAGEYTYSFVDDVFGWLHLPWGLQINNYSPSWYNISSEELIIDYSPLDGSTSCFIRID